MNADKASVFNRRSLAFIGGSIDLLIFSQLLTVAVRCKLLNRARKQADSAL